jgi:hypothetical protein
MQEENKRMYSKLLIMSLKWRRGGICVINMLRIILNIEEIDIHGILIILKILEGIYTVISGYLNLLISEYISEIAVLLEFLSYTNLKSSILILVVLIYTHS